MYIFCRVLIQINLIVPSKIAEEIDIVRLTKECSATYTVRLAYRCDFFARPGLTSRASIWYYRLGPISVPISFWNPSAIDSRRNPPITGCYIGCLLHKSCHFTKKIAPLNWTHRTYFLYRWFEPWYSNPAAQIKTCNGHLTHIYALRGCFFPLGRCNIAPPDWIQ